MLRGRLDRKLELKFRELAMKKFGYGKGALSKALEEAVMQWILTVESEELGFEGDPVEAIDGLLSGLDIDAVKLQHEIGKVWSLRTLRNVSRRH